MKNKIFITTAILFISSICISCDPFEYFDHFAIKIFIDSWSDETIGWEHNWNGYNETKGMIRRYNAQTIYYTDLPFPINSDPEVLEYFIETMKQENNNAYLTIYAYDETTQKKGHEITWHLNSNEDNWFLNEDNWELITGPVGDTFYYVLSLRITNDMLQKTEPSEE